MYHRLLGTRRADTLARLFTIIWLLWFAAMNVTGTSTSIVERWLKGHAYLADWADSAHELAILLGLFQLVIAILIAAGRRSERASQIGGSFLTLLGLGALSLMFTNPVWIESAGGFPAIGSGQGIIKYLAISGVGLWLMHPHRDSWPKPSLVAKIAPTVMLFGLMLVLGWIGSMKFTAVEAEGVYPLMTTSFLFSWIVDLFGKQGASNFIGIIELITVFSLTGWFWNKALFNVAVFLNVSTYLGTLSFMVTFVPTWTERGFPFMASTGQFLLKDIVLLAATLILFSESQKQQQSPF